MRFDQAMAVRVLTVIFAIINTGLALTCRRKSLLGFGATTNFLCPEFGQPSDHAFCCGPESNQHCCNIGFDSARETIRRTSFSSGFTTECTIEQFGITRHMTCPGAFDTSDKVFCCGSEENRYCCSSDELLSIAAVVGIVIAAVAVLIIVTLVCCCCCSCCLLAKRRERRGVVLIPSKPPESTTQVFLPPTQNYVVTASNPNAPYPTQAAYPMQHSAYPAAYPNEYPTAPPSDHGGYPQGPGFKYGVQPPPYTTN